MLEQMAADLAFRLADQISRRLGATLAHPLICDTHNMVRLWHDDSPRRCHLIDDDGRGCVTRFTNPDDFKQDRGLW